MVKPAGAKVTYEWSINGTVYATSESITVPASAKSGDRIKVKVTDADGETATDMVFVGGFTIVSVEPTTANDGGDYKYIRATFSSALSSLDPSEIEIRRKSDKQLYSVESVRLSIDGKVADITLFGDKDAAGTDFLTAATIYVMTVTHDGFTDGLEFQLPDNRRDLIVTGVDVEAGTIDTVGDGRTSYPAGGQFTVGDAYLGNLGSLVGRNVVLGLNADNELMNFEVEDQNVVIAKVKYVIPNGATSYDKCYFETPEETKYYLVDPASATTTVAATKAFDAADGTIILDKTGDLGTQAGNLITIDRLQTKDEYQYAKLVLNKNGRVATAMLQGKDAWSGHIIVTETDDTKVIESEDFALDFDGYTIVKDDEYVEVSDLEEGDICYYNSNDKFVDVYTESVTGNIEKITSDEITIDGTAYKWAGAQYLKDSKYVTLDQTDIDSDLAYLYSLDEDADTTLVLNRKGTAQVIDGTVKDETKTTSGIYVLTEAGAVYTIGKTTYIELNGTDDSAEKLVIDISKVAKYDGAKAKLEVGSDDKKYTVDGGAEKDGSEFVAGTPIKITKNDSGVVTEIDNTETTKAHTGDTNVNGKPQYVKADTTQLVSTVNATVTKITLKSSTPVYVVNDKKGDDGVAPFKVTKTTLGELTKTAVADKVTAYVKTTSTAADYVLVDNTRGNAWTTTDTETIGGIVTKVTKGLNQTSSTEENEAITLLTANGEVVLDCDELGYTTVYTLGTYVNFTVKKGTYTLATDAANADLFSAVTLDANRTYSETKFVDQSGTKTISKAATAKVWVYNATEKTYTETTIGAVNTTPKQADLKYHVVDSNTADVTTADVMVVTYGGGNPAVVTLNTAGFKGLIPAGTVIGTTVETTATGLTIGYALGTYNGTTFNALANVNLVNDAGELKIATGSTGHLTAGTEYWIETTPNTTGAYTGAALAKTYTGPVKTADAAPTMVTVTTDNTTANTAALNILDQFGNAATLASDVSITATALTGNTGHVNSVAGKIDKTSKKIDFSGATTTGDASGDKYAFTFLDSTITIVSAGANLADWTYGVAKTQ